MVTVVPNFRMPIQNPPKTSDDWEIFAAGFERLLSSPLLLEEVLLKRESRSFHLGRYLALIVPERHERIRMPHVCLGRSRIFGFRSEKRGRRPPERLKVHGRTRKLWRQGK